MLKLLNRLEKEYGQAILKGDNKLASNIMCEMKEIVNYMGTKKLVTQSNLGNDISKTSDDIELLRNALYEEYYGAADKHIKEEIDTKWPRKTRETLAASSAQGTIIDALKYDAYVEALKDNNYDYSYEVKNERL